jgi:hypothetical protein
MARLISKTSSPGESMMQSLTFAPATAFRTLTRPPDTDTPDNLTGNGPLSERAHTGLPETAGAAGGCGGARVDANHALQPVLGAQRRRRRRRRRARWRRRIRRGGGRGGGEGVGGLRVRVSFSLPLTYSPLLTPTQNTYTGSLALTLFHIRDGKVS